MTNLRSHTLQPGFTLVELMVAIAVLAIILVVAAKILSTTGTLTAVNNKHMDANDQARTVFDRMADDFARIVRRRDVDYIFWKAGVSASGVPAQTSTTAANDAMYFYTEGSSYFDTSTFNSIPVNATNSSEKNEISLVGYRVNNNGGTAPATAASDLDYYQLERLGKALAIDGGAWNSSPPSNNSTQPNVMVFLTYPPLGFDVKGSTTPTWANGATGTKYQDPTHLNPPYSNAYFLSTLAGAYSNNSNGSFGSLPSAVGSYPGSGVTAVFNDSTDSSYHSVGSQVFRFEYAFQLKDGTMSSIPVMTPNAATNALPNSYLSATQRPLPTDDSNADASGDVGTTGTPNYAIGSRWYDTTNQIGYICLDATPNAAIWHEIGIQDIAAIIVTVAVIDRQGLLYVQNSGIDMATVAAQLPDYTSGTDPANMINPASTYSTTSWTYALLPTSAGGNSPMASATKIPQAMVSQIRVYQRSFYLNSL